ncbi:MAG: hypothetical protein MJ000_11975 [Bacteroidales bacterium]|nr:hypothetical protein [Bacteroidales bacterium]MCQ2309116.1 hypothetical protein [Bacteroidales bacterium]
MFDTREYEWSDVSILIGTRLLVAARGVKYSTSQAKTPIYGKGNEPYAIQKGNKSHSGELTVNMSELLALQEASPTKSILDLQINITVCYGNPLKGDIMHTDKLLGVQFTEEPQEIKQGDDHSEHALPFIFLRKM